MKDWRTNTTLGFCIWVGCGLFLAAVWWNGGL